MKLYLISQTVNTAYETYDSAVVAAADPAQARSMHPSAHDDWNAAYTWCAPEHVQVKLIGTAAPGTPAGVILASFNAG